MSFIVRDAVLAVVPPLALPNSLPIGGSFADTFLDVPRAIWNHMPEKSTVLACANIALSVVSDMGSTVITGIRNFSYTKFTTDMQNCFNFQVDKMCNEIKGAGIIKTTLLVIFLGYALFRVATFVSNQYHKKEREEASQKIEQDANVKAAEIIAKANEEAEALKNVASGEVDKLKADAQQQINQEKAEADASIQQRLEAVEKEVANLRFAAEDEIVKLKQKEMEKVRAELNEMKATSEREIQAEKEGLDKQIQAFNDEKEEAIRQRNSMDAEAAKKVLKEQKESVYAVLPENNHVLDFGSF